MTFRSLYESKFRNIFKEEFWKKALSAPFVQDVPKPLDLRIVASVPFQCRGSYEPSDWKTVFEYDSILLSRQREASH